MGHQRRRPLRLAVLFLAFALVIAACSGGGGGGGGGGDSGTSTATKDGGTLSYAADQEPTGFNYNTSKDNGTSVLNVTVNMFPPVFRLHPDYSVQLNKELMDSAEQTSTDPQTIATRSGRRRSGRTAPR
jgi:peptide/nickel transport system substrate-binding protein